MRKNLRAHLSCSWSGDYWSRSWSRDWFWSFLGPMSWVQAGSWPQSFTQSHFEPWAVG